MKLKTVLYLLSLLMLGVWAQAATVVANVAKDGIAAANQPLYANWPAQQLIDGALGNIVHGDVNLQPGFAYTIDLGKDYSVSELKLYPRQDNCCPERLTNFRVSVHTDDNGTMGAEVWGANQFTDGSNPGVGAGKVVSIPLPAPATGRWIEIRSLADPVPNYALQIGEAKCSPRCNRKKLTERSARSSRPIKEPITT